MPIIDTVVLFAAADERDRYHRPARRHLGSIRKNDTYLASFALLEFDITLKSRGFSFEERMERHALLLRDYPLLDRRVAALSPSTFYLAARLEDEADLEYFDAGVAAEALQLDGTVISTDTAFEQVRSLRRIW